MLNLKNLLGDHVAICVVSSSSVVETLFKTFMKGFWKKKRKMLFLSLGRAKKEDLEILAIEMGQTDGKGSKHPVLYLSKILSAAEQ